MSADRKPATETRIAQGGHYVDPVDGGVVPPIRPSTTYARDSDYQPAAGRTYARDQNPTFEHAETLLAELEGGEAALLFPSGMAAVAAVMRSLAPGDHVLAPRAVYYGVRRWMASFGARWGVEVTLYPGGDTDGIAALLRPGSTRLVWLESPANPSWEITDIALAAEMAHAAGAQLVVDSTVATPVLTRPLALGADIVMHSATKYLNGHGDVVAGALVCRQADARWQAIAADRAEAGAIPGPFDAWLLQRGMRTLFLRVHRASESALAIARHFQGDARLTAVLYPGLESHPGHAVAARQMQGGFGGMLSLRIAGGRDAALAVAGRCRLFARATSLGGVESLVEHRATVEGEESPVPDDLLRLSVGIEVEEDLIDDLEQALGATRP